MERIPDPKTLTIAELAEWFKSVKDAGVASAYRAELRRRDEAVRKLVEKARIVVSDHENLEPTAHSIEDLPSALAAFEEPVSR